MVTIPRKISAYCPSCETHKEFEVDRPRKRPPSELKQGQRRFRRVTSGYGGFPRPKPEGREKPTKRVNLRVTCTECGHAYHKSMGRAKRFQFKE